MFPNGSVLDKAGVRIEPKISGESIPLSVEEPSKPNADETIEDLESSQIGESESSDESTTDEFPHFGEEAYDNMWQKTRCILAYVHDNYLDEYDYFCPVISLSPVISS